MDHTDKIVRIREVRDYMIPVYDEKDDEVAKRKAMEMLEKLKEPICRVEKHVVSVDTRIWRDENG
jgi:hypothetical protein